MTDSPVVVRRKRDGLYLVSLNPVLWSITPDRRLKSRAKAKLVIRVDLGENLMDFEILDAA